jgi:type II restriction enzyme
MQYCLVKIGKMKGHDVWVAANDRNKTYQGTSLATLTLAEIPHFAGPDVLGIAKMIDVIWFKKGTASPVCFFEIEHSTSVYSGLLRLNDVIIDYPVPKAFIVASPSRHPLFDRQIERRTFVNSELSEVCQFLSYDDVKKLMQSSEVIKTLLF